MSNTITTERIEIGPDGVEYVVGPGQLAPRILMVEAVEDHMLHLRFDTGEERVFSLAPYLGKGVFQRIQDPEAFEKVSIVPAGGGVEWASGPDLSAGTLYDGSKPA